MKCPVCGMHADLDEGKWRRKVRRRLRALILQVMTYGFDVVYGRFEMVGDPKWQSEVARRHRKIQPLRVVKGGRSVPREENADE
jgi:hypothetical protein